MKKEHKRRVKPYIKYIHEVAEKMNLGGWQINLQDVPADNNSIAQAWCVSGQKYAHIRLGSCFFERSPEEQRQTIVHELVHLHFAQMHNPLCDVLSKREKLFYVDAMEYGIDAMADIIAPSMPLP